jgi:hypothetical protein
MFKWKKVIQSQEIVDLGNRKIPIFIALSYLNIVKNTYSFSTSLLNRFVFFYFSSMDVLDLTPNLDFYSISCEDFLLKLPAISLCDDVTMGERCWCAILI